MSRRHVFYDVQCDGCPGYRLTQAMTRSDAHWYLATDGWTHEGHLDFCPVCTAAMKKAKGDAMTTPVHPVPQPMATQPNDAYQFQSIPDWSKFVLRSNVEGIYQASLIYARTCHLHAPEDIKT